MRKILFLLTVLWIFGCATIIYIIDYNQTVDIEEQNYEWLEKYGLDCSRWINLGYKLKLNKVLPLDKVKRTTFYLSDINMTGQSAVNFFTQCLLYGALGILLFFLLEPLIKKAILISIVLGILCIFFLEYSRNLGVISEFKWIKFISSSTFFSAFAVLASLLSKLKRKT